MGKDAPSSQFNSLQALTMALLLLIVVEVTNDFKGWPVLLRNNEIKPAESLGASGRVFRTFP